MEYSIVKIKKEFDWYRPGDVVSLSPMIAQRLIEDGIAERYIRNKNGNDTKDSSGS